MSFIKIAPLGGVGEIGMNMMMLETDHDAILIDCGVGFPDDRMLGVDLLIPDISYVLERLEKIRAIVITHGHEDHIGALPFVLKQIPTSVIGREFTLSLIRQKLSEHTLPASVSFEVISLGQKMKLGDFSIQYFDVTHSIPESSCLLIETPAGKIFHTGDFRIDYEPVYGEPFNDKQFQEIGNKGVDLMFCDSTNVEVPGKNLSENTIGPELMKYFEEHDGRIIISLFSSHIARIGQVLRCAQATGRKAFLAGRSLEQNVQVAKNHGYLRGLSDIILPLDEMNSFNPSETVVIATGSQAEPRSAITRMSYDEHRQVKISSRDLILFSSRVIPGNEKSVYRMINNLTKLGATIVLGDEGGIHVSGHSCAGEIQQMIELIRPKKFIPVHGEFRMLQKNSRLAKKTGVDESIVIENGQVIEFNRNSPLTLIDSFEAGYVLIEGDRGQDVSRLVLKDRIKISENGLVLCVIVFHRSKGTMAGEPTITTRGIGQVETNPKMLQDALTVVRDSINENGSIIDGDLQEKIRISLRRFFRGISGKKPETIVLIHEI